MAQPIKTALIYGSTRQGRFCDTVVDWIIRELGDRGDFALDPIDPAVFDPGDSAAMAELKARLGAAQAFIVVTPEYNHGYPAPLKALIDSVREEWQAKPVAFVSYGGISGGLRAVEQLRQVFAELHAVTIRDSVSFANARSRFDESGNPLDREPASKALALMAARLSWWATALTAARDASPYGAVTA